MPELSIQPMLPEHWPRVAAIFEAGINTRLATFRQQVPTWEEWDAGCLSPCRLIACLGGEIAGWAAMSPAYGRRFYHGVVENSLYIDPAHSGKGVGHALLTAHLAAAEQAGYWTVEARIIRENEASLAVHRACGFRDVGMRERFGRMASTGKWHDVLFLERRSSINGVD